MENEASAPYLDHLMEVIAQRRDKSPEHSYIAKMFEKGREKLAQKVGEEGVEVVIAAMKGSRSELVYESADLVFHWLMLLSEAGITVDEVCAELKRREGCSGLRKEEDSDVRA